MHFQTHEECLKGKGFFILCLALCPYSELSAADADATEQQMGECVSAHRGAPDSWKADWTEKTPTTNPELNTCQEKR